MDKRIAVDEQSRETEEHLTEFDLVMADHRRVERQLLQLLDCFVRVSLYLFASHKPLGAELVAENVAVCFGIVKVLVSLTKHVNVTGWAFSVDSDYLCDGRVFTDPEFVMSSHMFTVVVELSEFLQLVRLRLV